MKSRSFKSRLLASSIVAGSVLSSLSLPAFAQEDEEDEERREERVVVTGSRIVKRDYYANSPIETISSATIEVTGTINVEEILNIMPQAVPGLGRTSNNPGNGTATVDLRGFGPGRTLVLVDGRRFTPSGISAVDLNDIPPSLIESVEVITGGASAVYGSDAISGVVNFILKDNFQGLEVRTGYEATFAYGDTEYYDIGFTFGANLDDGKGNITFDMGHTLRKPVFQADRDFSYFALGDSGGRLVQFGSSGVPAGHAFDLFNFSTIESSPGSVMSTYTAPVGDTPGSCSAAGTFPVEQSELDRAKFGAEDPYCAGQAIFAGSNGFRPWINGGANNDRFNYAPYNYLMLPQERFYSTAKAHYNLNSGLQIYGQLTTAFNQVPQELAPTPAFRTVTTQLSNPLFSELTRAAFEQLDRTEARNLYRADWDKVIDDEFERFRADPANRDHPLNLDVTVPGNAAIVTQAVYAYIEEFKQNPNNGLPNPDDEKYDPDGEVAVFVGRRMVENGSRVSNNDRFLFQYTTGVRGDVSDNVSFDAYFQIGQYQNNLDLTGDVSLSRYLRGVNVRADADGNPVCVDTSGYCVPIDIWGEGDISAEAVDYTTLTLNRKEESNLKVLVANVTGNTDGVLNLQGGPIGWAAGIEYREQNFDNRPDDNLRTNNVLGFNSNAPLSGGFDVYEFYAETDIPISRDRPWAHLLELSLAARYSDYSTSGGVEAFKAGGTWAPAEDLRFRFLYNTAVRAPDIGELFANVSNSFPRATDPCSRSEIAKYNATDNPYHGIRELIAAKCTATGVPGVGQTYQQRNDQIESVGGGNPNLQPEAAETLTFGFVWRPQALEGLDVSLDYYSVEVEDYITTLAGGVGGILAQCYLTTSRDINSVFCRSVIRDQLGEPIVLTTSVNAATLTASGIDLSIDYLFELDNFPGRFSLDYVGSYRDEYNYSAFDGAAKQDFVGKFSGGGGGEPLAAYKHNLTVNWALDEFSFHLDWSHLGAVEDEGSVIPKIDAYNFFTASATWDVSEKVRLIGGIKNLFDIDPPILGSNQEQGNTHPATYDPYGRIFYVRTKFSF